MKNNEQKEIELFRFIDKVKERWQNAIDKARSAEELRDEISKMCLNCFKTMEDIDSCDLCYGNTRIDDQLYLNFEVLDAEIEDGSEK